MNWIQKSLKKLNLEYSFGDSENYEDYFILNNEKPSLNDLENTYLIILNEEKKQEILLQLDLIDKKSIRALREQNTDYLESYENQAKDLRNQLKNL